MKTLWKGIRETFIIAFAIIYALPMLIILGKAIILLYVFYYPTGYILTLIEAITDGKDRRLIKLRMRYFNNRMNQTAGKIFNSFFG